MVPKKEIILMKKILLLISIFVLSFALINCRNRCKMCVVENTFESINFNSLDYPKRNVKILEDCDDRFDKETLIIDTIRYDKNYHVKRITKVTCD